MMAFEPTLDDVLKSALEIFKKGDVIPIHMSYEKGKPGATVGDDGTILYIAPGVPYEFARWLSKYWADAKTAVMKRRAEQANARPL